MSKLSTTILLTLFVVFIPFSPNLVFAQDTIQSGSYGRWSINLSDTVSITNFMLNISVVGPNARYIAVYVESPDSTIVELTNPDMRLVPAQDFDSTTFVDTAAQAINTSSDPHFHGYFRPYPGHLSAFNGKRVQGWWRFIIENRQPIIVYSSKQSNSAKNPTIRPINEINDPITLMRIFIKIAVMGDQISHDIQNTAGAVYDWFYGRFTPVEMTSFTAIGGDSRVNLSWRTESETNNDHFILYRSNFENVLGSTLTHVPGHGTTALAHDYSYVDHRVQNGITYYYRISDVDLSGIEQIHPYVVQAIPSAQAVGELPSCYQLEQNYPNPFNPVTKFTYSLPEAGKVKLSVFNELGREVALLVNQSQLPNVYRVNFDASQLPSGIYFYSLRTDNFSSTKRMVLLK